MLIGITGGIGTGKSYIAKLLNLKGHKVILSDLITRRLLEKNEINYKLVVGYFGKEILDNEKNIDRSKLKKIILEDEKKRLKLNSLTHPNIMKEIKKQAEEAMKKGAKDNLVFIEIPLLYETGLEDFFDDIWLIDCFVNTQISRVCVRDGATTKEVELIIDSQLKRDEKLERCNIVIDTEKNNMEELDSVIDDILKKYRGF